MEYKSIIAIRFHQISVSNELIKTYQNAIAKDVETEKWTCDIFCFGYQMWKYYIKTVFLRKKSCF